MVAFRRSKRDEDGDLAEATTAGAESQSQTMSAGERERERELSECGMAASWVGGRYYSRTLLEKKTAENGRN